MRGGVSGGGSVRGNVGYSLSYWGYFVSIVSIKPVRSLLLTLGSSRGVRGRGNPWV